MQSTLRGQGNARHFAAAANCIPATNVTLRQALEEACERAREAIAKATRNRPQ